jgi:hypothetical protein
MRKGPKFSDLSCAPNESQEIPAALVPLIIPSCALIAVVLSVREERVEPTTLPDEHDELILALFQIDIYPD